MTKSARRTDPGLWERVKEELTASGNGGAEGQWSARKVQLAVQEYKRRGGKYSGPKDADNNLVTWTRQQWGTRSGADSRETGERYLPKRALEALSTEEYTRTTRKKRKDTREGRQHSKQPPDVARKTARLRKGRSRAAPKG